MKNKKLLRFIKIFSKFDYKYLSEEEIFNELLTSNDILYVNYLSIIKNLTFDEENLKVIIYNILDKCHNQDIDAGCLLTYNNSAYYYFDNKWYDTITPKSYLIFKNYYCVILKEKNEE